MIYPIKKTRKHWQARSALRQANSYNLSKLLRQTRRRKQSASLSQGFSLIEVMVAVLIGTAALGLLIPALSNQLDVSRQAGRLTTVEAIVTRDLYWFNNYARFWKMSKGIYSLNTTITKTTSYNASGLAEYEPPPNRCRPATPAQGLAKQMIIDAQSLFYIPVPGDPNSSLLAPFSPAEGTVSIPVSEGGRTTNLTINRRLFPVGNRLVISYDLSGSEANGLRFSRVASVFVEASAWCDVVQ